MAFPLLIVSLFHDEMSSNIIIFMKVAKAALSPMRCRIQTWYDIRQPRSPGQC